MHRSEEEGPSREDEGSSRDGDNSSRSSSRKYAIRLRQARNASLAPDDSPRSDDSYDSEGSPQSSPLVHRRRRSSLDEEPTEPGNHISRAYSEGEEAKASPIRSSDRDIAALDSKIEALRSALASTASSMHSTINGLLEKCSRLEVSSRRTRKVVDRVNKAMTAADVQSIAYICDRIEDLSNSAQRFWGRVGDPDGGPLELVAWLEGIDEPLPEDPRSTAPPVFAPHGSWLLLSYPMVRAPERMAAGKDGEPVGREVVGNQCVWIRVWSINQRAVIEKRWVKAYDENNGKRFIVDISFKPDCACSCAHSRSYGEQPTHHAVAASEGYDEERRSEFEAEREGETDEEEWEERMRAPDEACAGSPTERDGANGGVAGDAHEEGNASEGESGGAPLSTEEASQTSRPSGSPRAALSGVTVESLDSEGEEGW